MSDDAVVWHDLECGIYVADLPLWRELAATAGCPVLDVGAGTGRVALDLARLGHDVTALDSDPGLLAALRERAGDLPVETVCADARDFDLGDRIFDLCLVPMQTLQLLGPADARASFFTCARRHLRVGALLAAAIADPGDGFDPAHSELPLPDLCEREGFVYASQPVAVRPGRHTTAIERLRETVAPDGSRSVVPDVVRLERVSADQLGDEAEPAGFEALPPRSVAPTDDHVGSEVVMLRAH